MPLVDEPSHRVRSQSSSLLHARKDQVVAVDAYCLGGGFLPDDGSVADEDRGSTVAVRLDTFSRVWVVLDTGNEFAPNDAEEEEEEEEHASHRARVSVAASVAFHHFGRCCCRAGGVLASDTTVLGIVRVEPPPPDRWKPPCASRRPFPERKNNSRVHSYPSSPSKPAITAIWPNLPGGIPAWAIRRRRCSREASGDKAFQWWGPNDYHQSGSVLNGSSWWLADWLCTIDNPKVQSRILCQPEDWMESWR